MSRKKFKDYGDYLNSNEWKSIKDDYNKNENSDMCLCCGNEFDEDFKPNYHHFKYPKDWNDDSWENLIVVCSGCHDLIHVHIEHNSDDISLRTYLSNLNNVIQIIGAYDAITLEHEDIWVSCQGDFTISQKGISSKKIMKANIKVHNNDLISFFEHKRDSCINKAEEEAEEFNWGGF